jgi:sulfofructose kinase
MMAVADYFIPSADFFESSAPGPVDQDIAEKMRRLQKQIDGKLIVTHGEQGAYFIDGDRLYHVGVPPVKAADTTGAGDNFHATFALSVARGLSLHQAVRMSVASASMSCRQYGGRNGIPTWPEAKAAAECLTAEPVA